MRFFARRETRQAAWHGPSTTARRTKILRKHSAQDAFYNREAYMKILVLLLAFSVLPLLAQNMRQDPMDVQTRFVIDPNCKPYVYLEVDHVGPRTPKGKGEPEVGIWLRLRNNSRLPIIVSTFGGPPGSPDCGVMDEVVRNSTMEGAATIKSMADLSASPKQTERRRTSGRYPCPTYVRPRLCPPGGRSRSVFLLAT